MKLRTRLPMLLLPLAAVALCASLVDSRASAGPAPGTPAARAERLARAQGLLDRLRGAPEGPVADAPSAEAPMARDRAELNQLARQHADAAGFVDPTAAPSAWPWSAEFGDPGPPGTATAATIYQSQVVIAGPFARLGSLVVNNVARWADGEWAPMGAGFPHGVVDVLFERDGQLYAAGAFTLDAAYDFVQLAVWDGQRWNAISSPGNGTISGFAPGNAGTLLAAGMVAEGPYGGQGVWMWNGTTWSSSEVGVDACSGCRADNLVRVGEWAYLAGKFAKFGGKVLPNIARVRLLTMGFGNVFAVGDGLDGAVNDLMVLDGDVIAAGEFTHSGTMPLAHVARWDGTQWHPMGQGLDGAVQTLVMVRGHPVAAGAFSRSGTTPIRHLAVWDGVRWTELAGGFAVPPTSLVVAGDLLLASGYPGGLHDRLWAGGLCYWDTAAWHRFGVGVDAPVRALAVDDDRMFAVGTYHSAGTTPANYFSFWDGVDWIGTGSGTLSPLNAVAVQNGDVYVAGPAVTSGAGGSSPWRRVAQVINDEYVPLGYGPDAEVLCLLPIGRGLVAGGAFTSTGQGLAQHIARWDGARWNALGAGLDGNVHALAVYGGRVIAGGQFEHAGSIAARNVAAWDGSDWGALGAGLDGRVECLAVFRDQLYAGGRLGLSGGSVPRGVARWQGQQWEEVAGGLDGIVLALRPVGELLFAGGWFAPTPTAGGANLALFDGDGWRGVGSGLDGWVDDIALYRGKVHLAGGFTRAGAVPSRGIARLELDFLSAPEPPLPAEPATILGGEASPNPFNPATSLRFSTSTAGRVQARVFDVRGRLVRTLLDEALGTGLHELRWNGADDRGRNVAGGSYVVRIELNGAAVTRKVVLLE